MCLIRKEWRTKCASVSNKVEESSFMFIFLKQAGLLNRSVVHEQF